MAGTARRRRIAHTRYVLHDQKRLARGPVFLQAAQTGLTPAPEQRRTGLNDGSVQAEATRRPRQNTGNDRPSYVRRRTSFEPKSLPGRTGRTWPGSPRLIRLRRCVPHKHEMCEKSRRTVPSLLVRAGGRVTLRPPSGDEQTAGSENVSAIRRRQWRGFQAVRIWLLSCTEPVPGCIHR